MTDNSIHANIQSDNCENHEKRNYDAINLRPCPKCNSNAGTFSDLIRTAWWTGCYRCNIWADGKTARQSREEWNGRVGNVSI